MKMKKIYLLMIFFFAISNVGFAEKYQIYTTENRPYNFSDEKGRVDGIAVDVIRELFKRSKLDYKLKVVPLARAINQTKSKKEPNACTMPLQRSQEREYSFKWVGPLLITQSAIFSTPDSKLDVTVLRDVFNSKVGALRGSDEAEYLSGFGVNTDLSNSDKSNVSKLGKNRIALWAVDRVTGPYHAQLNKVKIKERIVFRTTLMALACNLSINDNIIKTLDDNLSQMYADGTMKKIFSDNAKKFNIDSKALFF